MHGWKFFRNFASMNKQNGKGVSTKQAKVKAKPSVWKSKLGDYLLDISKYVVTGVVITSLFNDVTDKAIMYLIGICIVVFTLWAGLILTNNKKEEE